MMEEKRRSKLRFVWYALIIMFAFLYITGKSGYYTKINNKSIITKDAIDEFEKDVQNGMNVDLKDYIDTTVVDYSNPYSNLGDDISNLITDIFKTSFNTLKKIINALFS